MGSDPNFQMESDPNSGAVRGESVRVGSLIGGAQASRFDAFFELLEIAADLLVG